MTSGKAKELQMPWNDQDYQQMRQLLRFVHSEQGRPRTLQELHQLVTLTMPYKIIWDEFVASEIPASGCVRKSVVINFFTRSTIREDWRRNLATYAIARKP